MTLPTDVMHIFTQDNCSIDDCVTVKNEFIDLFNGLHGVIYTEEYSDWSGNSFYSLYWGDLFWKQHLECNGNDSYFSKVLSKRRELSEKYKDTVDISIPKSFGYRELKFFGL